MAAGVTVSWAVTAAGIEANAIPKIEIRSTCKGFTSLMMRRIVASGCIVITVLSSERKIIVTDVFGADYNRASRDTKMILPAKFRWVFLPVLLAPIAAFAHHAYTAEFDTTKPVKLSGVLT